ncbi:MAG: SDR family oxidoreductase, partial [Candidatus Udaeobacter sp.]
AELAAAKKQIGKNVTAIQGDMSNLDDLDGLFAQIKKEKGKIDIVFANAGVSRYAPIGTITEDFFDSIFDINVKGVLFTVQKALPLLCDGGSIILNASIVASKGLSSNSVYSATTAAVRSFARTWTTDLKDRRIRVNAISPGPIDTPGLSELLASSETGEQMFRRMTKSECRSSKECPNDELDTEASSFVLRHYDLPLRTELIAGNAAAIINITRLWRSMLNPFANRKFVQMRLP